MFVRVLGSGLNLTMRSDITSLGTKSGHHFELNRFLDRFDND